MRVPYKGKVLYINPAITPASGVCIEVTIRNEKQVHYCKSNGIPLVETPKGTLARVYLSLFSKAGKGISKRVIDKTLKVARQISSIQ